MSKVKSKMKYFYAAFSVIWMIFSVFWMILWSISVITGISEIIAYLAASIASLAIYENYKLKENLDSLIRTTEKVDES